MAQDVNYAQQFEDTFYMLSEIQGGRIAPFMREEEYSSAESVYYDQMKSITEVDRTERFGRTNFRSIDTTRRRLTVEDKNIAIQIDAPDENRTLADIRNPNIKRIQSAWARSKDVTGIKAALGTTYSGKNGETANAFDFTNQIVPVGTTGLTVDKLIAAKELFWSNDIPIDDPMYKLHMAVNGSALASLLADEKITSSDYAQVKALVNGEIDYYMGIQFHRTELLPFLNTANDGVYLNWTEDATYGYVKPVDTDTTKDRCVFAWAQDCVCVGTNQRYKFRAEELQEYNWNFGLYAEWSLGGMRQEEKAVVAIACSEA